MSSVSPSNDSGLANYYYKAARELQDNADLEAKKSRQQHEKEIENLQKGYQKVLSKQEADTTEEINSIRDASDRSLLKEKEKFNNALDQFKDETYNRRGVAGSHLLAQEDRYRKAAQDLTEQLDQERMRHSKEELQTEKTLKSAHENDLRNQENENKKTLESARQTAADALTQEKQKYDTHLEELSQKSTNDRMNTENGMQQYYKKTINDMIDNHQADLKRNQDNNDRELSRIESSSHQALLNKGKEAAETLQNVKDNLNEDMNRSRLQYQTESDKLKNQSYDSTNGNQGAISPRIYQQQLQGIYDSMDTQRQNNNQDIKNLGLSYREKLSEHKDQQDAQISNIMQNHAEEIKDYEDKLKSLKNYDKKLQEQNSETLNKHIQEHDDENRSEKSRIQEALKGSINQLNNELDHNMDMFGRRNVENLREKDEHYSELFHKQNQDNFDRLQSLESEYKHQFKQLQGAQDLALNSADKKTQTLLDRSNLERQAALENQARTYQEAIENIQQNNGNTVANLQKELNKQQTSMDAHIPDQLAEAIKAPIHKEYEKKLSAEAERNQKNADSMQRRYIEQYQRAIENFATKEAKIHHKNNVDQATELSRYFDSIQEMEYQTKNRLAEQGFAQDRKEESLFRQFGNALERQKQDYDQVLSNAQDDFAARILSLRQELETDAKTQHRALNARQNELIRDYEKKLADQKAESDFQVENLKAQAQLDLRNLERKSKQELEAQAKGYEQRLTQAEAQSKERERYMTQNYQEELEKTKRSYEFISKKKS